MSQGSRYYNVKPFQPIRLTFPIEGQYVSADNKTMKFIAIDRNTLGAIIPEKEIASFSRGTSSIRDGHERVMGGDISGPAQTDLDSGSRQQEQIGDCTICLGEYDTDNPQYELPCPSKHTYHQECIERWLFRSSRCPICRGPVPADVLEKIRRPYLPQATNHLSVASLSLAEGIPLPQTTRTGHFVMRYHDSRSRVEEPSLAQNIADFAWLFLESFASCLCVVSPCCCYDFFMHSDESCLEMCL